MTDAEIVILPMGAKLMTYECGVCFLTNDSQGNARFCIRRPDYSLDRTRIRFKLVWDMDRKRDQI